MTMEASERIGHSFPTYKCVSAVGSFIGSDCASVGVEGQGSTCRHGSLLRMHPTYVAHAVAIIPALAHQVRE